MLRLIATLSMIIYLSCFLISERMSWNVHKSLNSFYPASFVEATSGLLKQLVAEMMFVRTSVFLGQKGIVKGEDEYGPVLLENFKVITALYPELVDTYYLGQSSLPHINNDLAGGVCTLLEKAEEIYPNDVIFPFFRGFDLFYYLGDNLQSAEVFLKASSYPDAPAWYKHLAAILSAREGDLYAGLLTLRGMAALEQDPEVKVEYEKDIQIFTEALNVARAVDQYRIETGHDPIALDDLVPDYMSRLPVMNDRFSLEFLDGQVRLIRPLKN